MTASNPMESVFIGIVDKLVQEIFKRPSDNDEREALLSKLNSHLEKAQKQQMPSYEGKAYNALAIYNHVLKVGDFNTILAHLQSALACAERAENIDLQVQVLNNLGVIHSTVFDIEQTKSYYEQIIRITADLRPIPVSAFFAYSNLVKQTMLEGNWDYAQERLQQALETLGSAKVTSVRDYARVIYQLRLAEVRIKLIYADYPSAVTALGLARELSEQLIASGKDSDIGYLEAMVALVADKNADLYEQWRQQHDSEKLSVEGNLQQIALLQKTGFPQYAQPQAEALLKRESDNPLLDKIRTLITNLGVQLADS